MAEEARNSTSCRPQSLHILIKATTTTGVGCQPAIHAQHRVAAGSRFACPNSVRSVRRFCSALQFARMSGSLRDPTVLSISGRPRNPVKPLVQYPSNDLHLPARGGEMEAVEAEAYFFCRSTDLLVYCSALRKEKTREEDSTNLGLSEERGGNCTRLQSTKHAWRTSCWR